MYQPKYCQLSKDQFVQCELCSLSNYGLDCMNYKIHVLDANQQDEWILNAAADYYDWAEPDMTAKEMIQDWLFQAQVPTWWCERNTQCMTSLFLDKIEKGE